jgi:hypothetical protein
VDLHGNKSAQNLAIGNAVIGTAGIITNAANRCESLHTISINLVDMLM